MLKTHKRVKAVKILQWMLESLKKPYLQLRIIECYWWKQGLGTDQPTSELTEIEAACLAPEWVCVR